MKIALFTHQYLPRIGGVQVLVYNVIQYLLHETDHEVLLLAPYYDDVRPPVETNGRLTTIRLFNPAHKTTLLRGLFELSSILKREHPDVIHGQELLTDGFFCRYAHDRTEIPYVLSTQGEMNPLKRDVIPWHTKLKIHLTRWTMAKAGGVIAPEPTIMAKMKQYIGPGYPYERVNNAIYISAHQKNRSDDDLQRLSELGLESEKFFLFLGRIVPEKGVFELVDAVEQEQELFEDKSFKVFFSGEGRSVPELQAIIKRQGLVSFFGFSVNIQPNDKWILLRHCRAMVLPSWEENLPISILEAFGVETPVIGSDIKEIKNLMLDSIVGKTFIKQNSESLAKVLREDIMSVKRVDSDLFLASMASYDLKQMGSGLTELYEKAIMKSRSPR